VLLATFELNTVEGLLIWAAIGGLVGWLAGRILGRGFGCVGDLVIGIAGSILGGFLLNLIGIEGGLLWSLVSAFVGAVILLSIVRLIPGRRKPWEPSAAPPVISPASFGTQPAQAPPHKASPATGQAAQPPVPVAQPQPQPTSAPQVSIFISYSRTDSAFVDRLERDLKTLGFSTWVDRRKLEGGQNWMDELQRAIDRCQVVLVVLSHDAAASQYVRMEYRYALRKKKQVIPLDYRPVQDVPMDLPGLQWVNFQSTYEGGLRELLAALRR
jgi:uncharacterized membrane protein YeaQ/YmgE (transglycosylase-associated protein family)